VKRNWLLAYLCALCASLILPVRADAQQFVHGEGQAVATIIARLSFIKTQDLDFGQIAASNSAGTVTIAPNGARSKTGGVTLFGESGSPARFAGYGFPSQSVLISITAPTGVLTRTGGSETMQFDTFVVGSSPQVQLTTAPRSFRIASSSGMFAFPIGATLRVKRNQMPGIYSGTFSITLQYQ
jgi:hypothetical protein